LVSAATVITGEDLIIEMNMQLESKDLMIVNSTIISGILILLTISSFSPVEFPNRSIFVTLAVLSVIFFSISSLYVLSDNLKKAKIYIQIGFGFVICFMIFIGIVNIINIVNPDFWDGPIASKIATNLISKMMAELEYPKFIYNPH
jgi:hypothetical protein